MLPVTWHPGTVPAHGWSHTVPPHLSRARQEFTAASAAPRRVHLPLASAASVVVTLRNYSCIDLKEPMHQGI